MKILLVGDMHIDNTKSSITNNDSFIEVFNTFNLIKDNIYKHKPEYVIFFGDIFNSPTSITTVINTVITQIIAEIAIDTTVVLIMGNHDSIDDKVFTIKSGENSLKIKASLVSPFRHYNNVIVFDQPSVAAIDKGLDFAFVPFTNNTIESLESIKNRFNSGNKRILLGHIDIKTNQFKMIDNNQEISNTMPSLEDIVDKYKYDLSILGHLHEPHEHIINNKLIKYLGSCRNINFGSISEQKGIYLFDTKTFEFEYIDNPYTNIFKTFRSFDLLKEFCMSSNPETLSRTKIKFIFNSNTEIQKVSKLKEFFKSVQFEKSIISTTLLEGNNVSEEMLSEFEELMKNNMITKEKIIEYALQFKEPSNKAEALKIFNMIIKD